MKALRNLLSPVLVVALWAQHPATPTGAPPPSTLPPGFQMPKPSSRVVKAAPPKAGTAAQPAPAASPNPPSSSAPAKPAAGDKNASKAAPAEAAETGTTPAKEPDVVETSTPGGFVLNLQSASLTEVVDILARRLQINYILDPRVKGAVTLNTYGEIRQVDTRSLLETILRINNAAMVQVGDIYRIVPVADASRLPLPPQVDASEFPASEQMMLNLIFLKYTTVGDLTALLEPFLGEGAKMVSFIPANLLLILDNTRSMKRTMDLISMFDNDTLAGKRVRLFETRNSRPSDLAREMDNIMRAVSLGEKGSAIKFLPIDRINTIVAIAPNPGVFEQVETWIRKLDVKPKVTAGTVENYVYRVKYGCSDTLASAIMQLYLGYGFGMGYGMGMGMNGGNCGLGQTGLGGSTGATGGYGGMGGFGGGGGMMGGGMMGGGMYGGGMYGGGMYGGGMYGTNGMYGSSGMWQSQVGQGGTAAGAMAAGGANPSAAGTAGSSDLTGSYLGTGMYGYGMPPASKVPRIIPNPFDNTLLIQSTAQDYEQILKTLAQLDVPPRQVLIEAKIYEVNLQGDFESGVSAYLSRLGSTNPTGFPSSRQLQGSISSAGVALTAGVLVGASRQLLGILAASEMNNRAKLVSAPSIIATDSIAATMNVGDSVPTLTGQAVNGIQQGGSSLFTQAIQNVQTGVTLNIVPRVTPTGIVTLRIQQDVSSPVAAPAGSAIQSPTFQKRTFTTQVTVQDGDTIAIGGIISETTTVSSSGVPLLHRIPGVGAAFSSKSIKKTRTELVVLMTPRVIYDTNQIVDATDELKSSFKRLKPLLKD